MKRTLIVAAVLGAALITASPAAASSICDPFAAPGIAGRGGDVREPDLGQIHADMPAWKYVPRRAGTKPGIEGGRSHAHAGSSVDFVSHRPTKSTLGAHCRVWCRHGTQVDSRESEWPIPLPQCRSSKFVSHRAKEKGRRQGALSKLR